MRRRSAASASRERVKAFSFTRSCWCAASHSCCDTIGGVFISRCPFPCSLALSFISISPCYPVSARFLLIRFFLREIFTANAATPPVEIAVPATTNPMVAKQNGHILHPLGGQLD